MLISRKNQLTISIAIIEETWLNKKAPQYINQEQLESCVQSEIPDSFNVHWWKFYTVEVRYEYITLKPKQKTLISTNNCCRKRSQQDNMYKKIVHIVPDPSLICLTLSVRYIRTIVPMLDLKKKALLQYWRYYQLSHVSK